MILLKSGKKIIINEIARVCMVGLVALSGASGSFANPVLDSVAHGNVSVTQTPNTTTVNQTSQQAIIRWQSFNIGQHESTHFQQPAGGVALNRINPAQGPSSIYGRLTATGQIVLVNPAGIFFGPSAFVNVGGIVASTVDMSDQSFLSGQYRFDGTSPFNGSVVNEGTIIALNHGLVALLGNGVRNDGMIEAQLGQVVLASGSAFTMNFNGNQMISFSVDKKALEGVKTGGYISANGGQVLITAKAAQGVLDHVINMDGIVEARSVAEHNGSIIISGDEDAGVVQVGGEIYADGLDANETGGSVQVTGYNLMLSSGTTIDVSGASSGGQILIGGDFQGQGSLPHANAVIMQPGVNLIANAVNTGNGGKVVLWSDYVTKTAGYISAQGGAMSGNGGIVETSGKQFLEVGALTVNTLAANGTTGTWLLDPTDVTISAVADDNLSFDGTTYQPTDGTLATSNIDVANLIAQLDLTNIIVTTTPVAGAGGAGLGDITVSSAISWTGATTLTLDAENDIIINAPITASAGNLALQAVNAITINSLINVDGSFDATADTITLNANVTSGLDQNYTTTTSVLLASSVLLTSNLGGVNIFTNASGLNGGGFDLSLDVFSASTIDAIISNLANLNKDGTGALSLTVANTYTGTTTIDGGSIIVLDNNSLGDDTATVVVNNNGNLNLGSGTLALNQNMTFNNGSFLTDDNLFSANALNGTITMGAGTITVTVTDAFVFGNILSLNGAIGNTGDVTIVKNGSGQLALTNTNDLTVASLVNVNAGTVVLASDAAAGDAQIAVAGSAILQLSGSTLNIDNVISLANGATIIDDNVAGDNILSGDISLNGTNTIAVNNSIGALTLSGIVSGSGVTLVKSGDGLLILSGGSANTYSGAFNITAGSVEARKSTALGAGASAVTVSSGAALLINGTALSIANNITLNGTGIGGTGVLIDNSIATNNTLSGNITLASNNSIIRVANNGNTLTISGVIDDGASSFGFSKTGSGILTLSGANLFGNASNGLTITTGQVTAMNSAALGASTAPGVISNGALLAVSGSGLSIANPLTINGTGVSSTGALINSSGNNAWSGAITLGSNSSISVNNLADTFTISGAIDGSFNLTKVGSGVLALSNTNTYTGSTTVSAGTLDLTSATALGTVGTHTSGVTVSNGATILLSNSLLAPTLTLNLIGTGVGGNGALRATGTSAWNGNITLTGNTTIASANALTLNGTINGAFNLTLNGAGNMLLGNTIGNSVALTSLTANINLDINSGTVTTTGTQTYNNAVVLGADSVFSSTGNNTITFNAIDRDASARSLTIGQTGNAGIIALNGNIGAGVNGALGAIILNSTNTTTISGTVAAASLVTDAGGNTQINTTSIVTTGSQTYGDDVALGASPTLNSGSGTMSFAGLVAGLTRTLSLQSSLATGSVTFNGNVSLDGLTTFAGAYAVSFLASLNSINTAVTFLNTNGVTIGNGGDVSNFNGGVISTASTTTLGGTVNTSADAAQFGALTIASNSTIATSGGALTIGITNSNAANTNDFTISSGAGTITLNGAIGTTTALDNFTALNSGALNHLVLNNNIVTATGINLTAGGTITGSGTFTTATLTTSSVGGTTLTNNHLATNLNATNITSGDITFTGAALAFTTTGVSNAGGGDVIISNANGIAVQTSTNISAASGGDISLNAGANTLTLNAASLLLSTGVITLTQDLINFNATAQIGGTGAGVGNAATTIITASTANRTIGVAGGTGNLALSAAALNTIRSTNLRIGNTTNAGALDVGAWTPAASVASGVLTLASSGAITQSGILDLSTSGSDLIFRAGTTVNFTLNNSLGNIAANVGGDISVSSATTFTISSLTDDLGTVNGITTTNDNITLNSGAAIADAVGGLINGATLTTTSVTGTLLDDNSHTVNAFNATNSGVGDVLLVNTAAPITITGMTQTGTGLLSVDNTGAIIVTGSIAAGAGNSVLLLATDTITQSGSGTISGGTLSTTSGNGVNLNLANTVTGYFATNTTSGNINLVNTAPTLTITGNDILQSSTGSVSILNNGHLTVTGDITLTTGLLNLTAAGVDRVLTVNGNVSGVGDTTYSADNMVLTGTTNAGTSIITLIPNNTGVLVDLGGADAPGILGLTDADLDTLTGSRVRIGNSTTGNITVSAAISPTIANLTLTTGGGISQTGGSTITATSLKLDSVNALSLTENNVVSQLAATISTASADFTFVNNAALNVTTVDGTAGISTNNGDIALTTNGATLTITNALSAGTASITLTTNGVDQLLTVAGNVTGSGGLTYIADNMTLSGTSAAGTGATVLRTNTTGAAIQMGAGVVDAPGVLGLSQTELATFTGTGTLTIGDVSNTGGITASNTVNVDRDFILTSGTTVAISAALGNTTALNSLVINAPGGISLGANITTDNTQTFNHAMTLTGGSSLSTTNSNVTFASTINGAQSLSIAAGSGATNFNGAIGLITPLSSLSVTNATNLNTGSVFTTGNQSFAALTLSAATQLNSSAGDLLVSGALNGAGFGLTVTNAGASSDISGLITNLTGLTKLGAGTLTVSGNNTGYSGTTTISAGNLRVTNTNSLGTGSLVFNAGNLQSSTTTTIANNYSLAATSAINGSNAITLSGNGALTTGTLNVTNTALTTLSGALSGAGNIDMNATGGTLVLSGNNTYTGTTDVTTGTLSVTNSNGLGTGVNFTSSVDVASGAVLNLAGVTIAPLIPLTLNGTGIASGGALTSSGTSRYDGSITSNAASIGAGGTLRLTGVLGGTSVTSVGAGTLVFENAGNNYSGATTINAGVLQLAANNNTTPSTTNVTVANGATFDLNGFNDTIQSLSGAGSVLLGGGTLTTGNASSTFSGVIDETGNLIKDGTGTFTISGINSFTGTTTINSGILRIGATNALPTTASIVLADAATAALDLNNFSTTIGSLSGGGATGGNITLGSGILTVNSASNTTYSGIISGTGGLTKAGVSTLSLAGDNLYTGATLINAGVLSTANNNAFGTGGTFTSGITVASGAALNLIGTTISLAIPLTLNGTGVANTGALVTTGTTTYAGGITLASTSSINNASILNLTGIIGGAGGLSSIGAGTLNLSGANTYGGATSISNNGVLVALNATALGSSAVGTTIDSNGVLRIATVGVIEPITMNNGALEGTGVASLTGAITLVSSSTNTITANPGSTFTLSGNVDGAGGLTLQGAGTFVVTGNIGATTRLSSLSVNSTNTTLNAAQIRTTGNQDYNNAILLGANILFDASVNNITFNSTFDGGFDATIVSGGTTTFTGVVGAVALNSLSVTANSIVIDGGAVTTVGNQTFTGAVTLSASTIFTSTSGVSSAIAFSNGILGSQNVTLTNNAGVGAHSYSIAGTLAVNNLSIAPAAGSTGNTFSLNTGGTQAWTISGGSAGSLAGVSGVAGTFTFSNIQNVVGGSGADSFTLAGGTLPGSVNGGGGTNTLTGDAVVSTWNVTGANAGAVTGVTGGFSNIQNLVGGNANNTFVFADGGSVTTLNGGSLANTNILDHSGVTSAVTIFLDSTFVGTTRNASNTVLNSFSNINQVNGDYANDIIDTSAKVFTVVETGFREGYIDDPLYYFGYLVQGAAPVPPVPPIPPDTTVDVGGIIQQPIINAEQNTPTQTNPQGEWTYTGETDGNLSDIIGEFETEYQREIDNIIINPTCYSVGT